MNSECVRTIPIIEDGQLIPEAGMLILGYMLYPNCERSAHQFARIVADETVSKARDAVYQPGLILKELVEGQPIPRLLLAGQVALRVCKNYLSDGSANLSRATHVVSELNATNSTRNGKPLPTAEGRLRGTFIEYRASIHFWAAAYTCYTLCDGSFLTGVDAIAEMHISSEFLGQFLAVAKQIEEILRLAKPHPFIWSATEPASEIWDFTQFPNSGPCADPPAVKTAMSSFKTRKKS